MPTMLESPPDRSHETEWREILDALTRREFLTGASAVALGLGLTACGTSASATSSGGATRVVETAEGKVRVPADPKRVVAIQPQPMVTLYDLGVNVVGVYDEGAEYVAPRYLRRYDAAHKVGASGAINVQKVAALNPDLIVGVNYSFNSDVYRQLTHLAPTVLLSSSSSWEAMSAGTADAVNRSGALAAFTTRLRRRSARIKATYAKVLNEYKWDILQGGFDQGQYWLYGPGSDIGTILAGAGVQFAPASAGTKGNSNRSISYENIDLLADAGVIGYYANYNDTPNNEGPELFAQGGFKALPATKAGRLVPIPDFLPGGYGDAFAALDELEAGLKKLEAG